ncbi:MAG: HAMP domain-containing protein [Patescibacteria group bacterium]
MHISKMGLHTKIVILGIVSVIGIFVILSFFVNYTFSNVIISRELDNYQQRVLLTRDVFELRLSQIRNDIKIISGLPPIQGIIRAQDNGGVDPLDGSSLTLWRGRLEQIFYQYATEHTDYVQMRMIDETGKELVRVDHNGVIQIVQGNDLQDKSDRHYFIESMAREPSSHYISAIDLNKEGSPPLIEIPHKPVIRYGMPVNDAKGLKNRAVVFINVALGNFLENVKKDNNETLFFIIDQDGYYISHSVATKEWGSPRDLNTEENVYNDYPELARDLLTANRQVIESADNYFIKAKVSLDGVDDKHFHLVKVVPKSVIQYQTNTIVYIILYAIGIFLLMFLLMLTYLLNTFTKPLKLITNAAVQIEEGNFETQLPHSGDKDTHKLVDAFTLMQKSLKKKQQELEDQIVHQQERIEVAKEELKEQYQESEKMNELMVNREIKMTELKNQLQELETKLASLNNNNTDGDGA